MRVLLMVVVLGWLAFLVKSLGAYSSYVDEMVASIERGASIRTLQVGAVVQSLWMYGGISALLFWFIAGTGGLIVGVIVAVFFATLLSAAVSNAARITRSQKGRGREE